MGVVDVVERLHTAQTCRCRCLTEEFAMILNLSTVTVGLLWFLHLWLQQLYIYESPYIYTYKYPHGGFLSHGVYLQNHPFKNRIVHQKNHPAIGGIPIYEKPHILHIIPSPQYKKPSENHILVGGLNTYLGP